jgi:hypothetical protein
MAAAPQRNVGQSNLLIEMVIKKIPRQADR